MSTFEPELAQKCNDVVAGVKLEWAGSGMPFLCDMTRHDCRVFLPFAPDHNNHMLAKRVRDLQQAVCDCIDMDCLKSYPAASTSILADCRERCSFKVRVFLGHSGPELTLAPWFLLSDGFDFMNLSDQAMLDHIRAWDRALSEYAAYASACQHPNTSCCVLAVSFYDDVACAVAYVHSMPCTGYRRLRKDLQHDKRVILSVLRLTTPSLIQDIVELCNSSVFRRDKDVLLAASPYYLALQYACTDLREDHAFVRQMMCKNIRAIEFASPSLLHADFVGEFFEDMTFATLETLLERAHTLQRDKHFMLKVLRKWPTLFAFVADELAFDVDIVCTVWRGVTGTELHNKLQRKLSPTDYASRTLVQSLMCRYTKTNDCGPCEPAYNSNHRIALHEVEDVDGLPEEYHPEVHHHEIVVCTTWKCCCSFCYTEFDMFERHYRCAAWCEWYSCTTCAKGLMA